MVINNQIQVKVPKDSYKKDPLPNNNGLKIHVFKQVHPENVVGIIVTKELKNSYKGYLARFTHDEFKQGLLKELNWEEVNKQ